MISRSLDRPERTVSEARRRQVRRARNTIPSAPALSSGTHDEPVWTHRTPSRVSSWGGRAAEASSERSEDGPSAPGGDFRDLRTYAMIVAWVRVVGGELHEDVSDEAVHCCFRHETRRKALNGVGTKSLVSAGSQKPYRCKVGVLRKQLVRIRRRTSRAWREPQAQSAVHVGGQQRTSLLGTQHEPAHPIEFGAQRWHQQTVAHRPPAAPARDSQPNFSSTWST